MSNESKGSSIIAALPASEWSLERQCKLIGEYYVSQWGCLQLLITREKGGDALAQAKARVLRRHQRHHFLPGVDKLGIGRDLPPAVIAARYHYFSNILGGIKMEYIEESPKKVWIRYRAPSFSFTGVSLAAVSSKVQRSMFSGWHPFNGESLGCPNLGFVVTKVFQDGEPYDEGYFEEFDQPLHADERIQYKPVLSSPDFDAEKAPKLDDAKWPLERQWKAHRNFTRGFQDDTLRTCMELYGVHDTAHYYAAAQRIFSIQFHDYYVNLFGIDGNKAIDFARLNAHISEMANELPTVREIVPGKYEFRRLNRLCSGEQVPIELYRAGFASIEMSAKIMSARIKVELQSVETEPGVGAYETWSIEDTRERLF